MTEAGLATWQRFRGRLGSADLLRLLAEDAAVGYPIPFDLQRYAAELDPSRIDDELVDAWLRELPGLDLAQPGAAYIEDQAKRLGVPTRLARKELHEVKQHQKLLELPGTGGQLSYHIVTTQDEPTLQVNCTIACGDWRELALAGCVALEGGAPPGSELIVAASAADLASDKHLLRQQRATARQRQDLLPVATPGEPLEQQRADLAFQLDARPALAGGLELVERPRVRVRDLEQQR